MARHDALAVHAREQERRIGSLEAESELPDSVEDPGFDLLDIGNPFDDTDG